MASNRKNDMKKVGSKKKETERNCFLSVSIEVSDIGDSHRIASAEYRWFVEHPYKATAGQLTSTTLCSNRLDGTNLSYLLEYERKIKKKYKEWSKSKNKITEFDFIFFLEKELGFKRSNKNTAKNVSIYKNFATNGKLITLRVSNHHYIHTHQEDVCNLTSLVLTNSFMESLEWNFPQTCNDCVIEYTYNVEDFTNEEIIELLKAVHGFFKSGIFSCSIKPDRYYISQKFEEKERRKAEKKEKKKGMGATSKNKGVGKRDSKQTNVKLVKTKLALKVKAAKSLALIS